MQGKARFPEMMEEMKVEMEVRSRDRLLHRRAETGGGGGAVGRKRLDQPPSAAGPFWNKNRSPVRGQLEFTLAREGAEEGGEEEAGRATCRAHRSHGAGS